MKLTHVKQRKNQNRNTKLEPFCLFAHVRSGSISFRVSASIFFWFVVMAGSRLLCARRMYNTFCWRFGQSNCLFSWCFSFMHLRSLIIYTSFKINRPHVYCGVLTLFTHSSRNKRKTLRSSQKSINILHLSFHWNKRWDRIVPKNS